MKLILDIGVSKTSFAFLEKSLGPASTIERDIGTGAIDWLLQEVEKIFTKNKSIDSVSVSSTGLIAKEKSHYLIGETADIVVLLQERFNVETRIINDGNAAALSASLLSTKRPLLSFHVGTGVGAGLLLEDGLYHGLHGYAGEMGEDLGGKRVADIYRNNSKEDLSAVDIAKRASLGNSVAQEAIDEARRIFIKALINRWRFIDPGAIVLSGGGVLDLYWPNLIHDIQDSMREKIYTQLFLENTEFIRSPFGSFAPLVGAALFIDSSLDLKSFDNYKRI